MYDAAWLATQEKLEHRAINWSHARCSSFLLKRCFMRKTGLHYFARRSSLIVANTTRNEPNFGFKT